MQKNFLDYVCGMGNKKTTGMGKPAKVYTRLFLSLPLLKRTLRICADRVDCKRHILNEARSFTYFFFELIRYSIFQALLELFCDLFSQKRTSDIFSAVIFKYPRDMYILYRLL